MSKRVLVWGQRIPTLGGEVFTVRSRQHLDGEHDLFPVTEKDVIDPLAPPESLVEAMVAASLKCEGARVRSGKFLWDYREQARAALKAMGDWKAGKDGG